MLSGVERKYHQYHAPQANDTALVVPSLDELAIVPPCPAIGLSLGEKSLADLRGEARSELLAAARAYTGTYRDLPPQPVGEVPVLLTGHQADLFHPGVWFKNFMLSKLAAERGGVGIHLVIDTDVVHTASVRVPTGSVDQPRIEAVPLDGLAAAMPVEERRVVDRHVFESFGDRVQQAIAPLVPQPLVERFWPKAVEAARRTDGKLGLAIAQARHQLEADWSATTLELPMSRCCDLLAFRRFCATMLLDAERVREAYNQSLSEYRVVHHLRSDAQPMPNLAADAEWIETPFWVWTTAETVRKPLFARLRDGELLLTNRERWTARLPLAKANAHESVVEQLGRLADDGIKVRTRALTTTLFARGVLGDLFLHGIGGAKYDEVTDELARRLWGCPPPPYATLSATLLLPIPHDSVGPQDLRKVRRQLRDSHWHPEHLLGENLSASAREAVASKRRWIAVDKSPHTASERHQAIETANAILRRELAAHRQALEAREQQLIDQARATAVLESREYSFCLFPEDDLRQRMWRLVENA